MRFSHYKNLSIKKQEILSVFFEIPKFQQVFLLCCNELKAAMKQAERGGERYRSKHRECGHTPEKRPNPAPAGSCPFLLVGIVPNPYTERRQHPQGHSSHGNIFCQTDCRKICSQAKKQENGKSQWSGVEKATPGGIENTGFFAGVGEGQGVYIGSPPNGGNSFYIASLSDTSADNPQSAHQPTHLGPIQCPIFKASKRRPHRG